MPAPLDKHRGTTLIGVIIGKTGAAGIPWTCVDPAGTLGRLARTAPLRAHARALDLATGTPAPATRTGWSPNRTPTTSPSTTWPTWNTDLHALGVDAGDLDTVTLPDLNQELVDQLRGRWLQRARVTPHAACSWSTR